MQDVPITEAKNAFTALVHQVEGGEIVHLTRHGRPVAVLLSEVDYQDLRAHAAMRGDLFDFVQNWRNTLPVQWQGISAREGDAMRDHVPNEDFAWPA